MSKPKIIYPAGISNHQICLNRLQEAGVEPNIEEYIRALHAVNVQGASRGNLTSIHGACRENSIIRSFYEMVRNSQDQSKFIAEKFLEMTGGQPNE